MKMLKITLEGKTYEVGVEMIDAASPAVASAPVQAAAPAVAAPAAAPVAAPAPAPAAGGQSVVCPMAGLVMKVNVTVGQQVAKDQEIMILEAMKMESPVSAPCAGTIAAISVKEGDAVSEGQVLIQIN